METLAFAGDDRAARYREVLPQLAALVEGEPDLIANLANITAALKECIAAASWVGFYLWRGDELVLGPFQGKIACVRIAAGRGVCGAAAARREPVIVPDVDAFPGHIACDGGPRSEIVVPIVRRAPARRPRRGQLRAGGVRRDRRRRARAGRRPRRGPGVVAARRS